MYVHPERVFAVNWQLRSEFQHRVQLYVSSPWAQLADSRRWHQQKCRRCIYSIWMVWGSMHCSASASTSNRYFLLRWVPFIYHFPFQLNRNINSLPLHRHKLREKRRYICQCDVIGQYQISSTDLMQNINGWPIMVRRSFRKVGQGPDIILARLGRPQQI